MYNHLISFIDKEDILYKFKSIFKSHSTNHCHYTFGRKGSEKKAFDTVNQF